MTSEDRERLRARVARAVMGWSSRSTAWAYSDTATLWHSPDGDPLVTTHAWRPDEDDRQCMQVLERMAELGYRCSIEFGPRGCTVAFQREPPAEPQLDGLERRVALLEAALEALGATR